MYENLKCLSQSFLFIPSGYFSCKVGCDRTRDCFEERLFGEQCDRDAAVSSFVSKKVFVICLNSKMTNERDNYRILVEQVPPPNLACHVLCE